MTRVVAAEGEFDIKEVMVHRLRYARYEVLQGCLVEVQGRWGAIGLSEVR